MQVKWRNCYQPFSNLTPTQWYEVAWKKEKKRYYMTPETAAFFAYKIAQSIHIKDHNWFVDSRNWKPLSNVKQAHVWQPKHATPIILEQLLTTAPASYSGLVHPGGAKAEACFRNVHTSKRSPAYDILQEQVALAV